VQLLQQNPLRADAFERVQQRGQKQLLRRYRRTAFCGVELTEVGIESIEGLIRQSADPPQRMTGWNPLLNRHVGEQGAATLSVRSISGGQLPLFADAAGFLFNELLGPVPRTCA